MKKHSRTWPDRLRRLLGQNPHSTLLHLAAALHIPQGLVLDWLMGKRKPPAKAAKTIRAIERTGGRPAGSTSLIYHPWYQRGSKPGKEAPPRLPSRGPLGYERYLDLLQACSRACLSRGDRQDDDAPPLRRRPWSPPEDSRFADEPGPPDRKQLFRRALRRLKEADRRFPDEIASFPLSIVAAREGWSPEELRIAAWLLKADVAAFEGPGQASGRLLAQIAAGPGGDRLAARKVLAPDGKLRKSGLVERANSGDSFFGPSRSERPSVLDGSYALTERGRRELLGPLLERSVSEEAEGGPARSAVPRFRLDAAILPPAHRRQIEDFRAELRHRKLLYETWGLGGVVHYGKGLTLLFEGPPGTGKTLLAEAIAGEEGLKFMTACFPQLVSKWVGETEKNIERLFREARESGALLFIDEADGIFGSRELAQHSWEVRDVNVLLKEIEDFEGVCVLATNNVAILDRALESRLSLRLTFALPDAEARLLIWKKHLPPQLPLAPDVDLETLARRYEMSGRDIKEAVRAAARAAVARAGAEAKVGMADLERAAGARLSEEKSIGFAGAR